MKLRSTILGITIVALAGLAMVYNSCGQPSPPSEPQHSETDLGNPMVGFSLASYNAATGFSGLTTCLKQIELSQGSSKVIVPLATRALAVPEQGAFLGGKNLKAGTYTDIKIVFSAHCMSGKSLEFTNSNGSFTWADEIAFAYVGSMVVGQSSGTVSFETQSFVNALNAVTTQTDVENAADSVDGTYTYQENTDAVWTGNAFPDNRWSTTANWFDSKVPLISRTAIFDGSCTHCDVVIDTSVNIGGVTMTSAYTGTLTQAVGSTIVLEVGAWSQSGGTFLGSNSDIILRNGSKFFLSQSGSFTSTSGNLQWSPIGTFTGTAMEVVGPLASVKFFPNGGTVTFVAPPNPDLVQINVPLDFTVNNLVFGTLPNSDGGFRLTDPNPLSYGKIIALGSITLGQSALGKVSINRGTFETKNNVTLQASFNGGTAGIRLSGTGQHVISQFSTFMPSLGLVDGGSLVLLTNVTIETGANCSINPGTMTMAGHSFTMSGILTNNGIINRNGGSLVYGTLAGTGTINP